MVALSDRETIAVRLSDGAIAAVLRRLAAPASERGVTPDEAVEAFARGPTGAPGNNAADEREMTRAWLRGVVWHRILGIARMPQQRMRGTTLRREEGVLHPPFGSGAA